jgi:alpha-L-fucosidase 2
MKTKLFAIAILLAGCGHAAFSRQVDLGSQIDRWDEAVPLGNGMTGSLLWGGKDQIRFSMDRGDLWDLRSPKELSEPGFTYANIQKLVKEKNQREINRLFDNIYNQKVPTKLPGPRIVINLKAPAVKAFSLNLDTGTGQVALQSGSQVEAFWIPGKPVMMVRIPAAVKDITLVPNTAVKRLGYPAAKISKTKDSVLLTQPGLKGFSYAIGVVWRKTPVGIELAAAMESRQNGENSAATVEALCRKALTTGWATSKKANDKWWKDFWAVSDVSIPDAAIQKQYDLAMYYYGAGSRKGCPPLPLQGVWTADQGGLPPWKGDYHHDMNTQVIYCAYYAAGHFKAGESLLDFMVNLSTMHRRFSKEFYGVDGLMVPGVMSFDGKPLGGWAQYALSPTMGPWLFQNFDWHWRYTQDKELLASRIYPYGKEMAKSVESLLIKDKNGKLKLPLSTSPEIHNNSLGAWLTPNTNSDLATMIWFFNALSQQADVLGKTADAKHFRAILERFEPLAVDPDSKVLMLDPVQRLRGSHRHHAHLMAIQPLEVITIEGGKTERQIIFNSLDNLRQLGTKAWVGFSFPWAASLEARAGRGELAEKYLSIFAEAFVSPNGFNLNGDQSGKGYSGFRYRPFTLDANFGHALAVQEMCLQSWGDTLRFYPAMPWKWHNASFRDFRTEGAHTVSARWENNATTEFKITAGKDGDLRIRNNFGGRKIRWDCKPVRIDGGDFVITVKKGDVIKAALAKPTKIPSQPKEAREPLLRPKPWGGLTDSGLPLRVGADSSGRNAFKGSMMDIAVYDRPLSPTEINQLARKKIRPADLLKGLVIPSGKKTTDTAVANLANPKLPVVIKGNIKIQLPGDRKSPAVFEFDGASWLEIPDHKSLKGDNGITLAAWINPTGPIPANGMRLLDKSPVGLAKGYLLDTYPKGKALRLFAGEPPLTAKAALSQGTWSHVAATIDAKTGKRTLYLNGKIIAVSR